MRLAASLHCSHVTANLVDTMGWGGGGGGGLRFHQTFKLLKNHALNLLF